MKNINNKTHKYIPKSNQIKISAQELEMRKTNVPEPYNVWWKVRNVGEEAYKRNCIRDQIEKNKGKKKWNTLTLMEVIM